VVFWLNRCHFWIAHLNTMDSGDRALSSTPSCSVRDGGDSTFSFADTADCTAVRCQETPVPVQIAYRHQHQQYGRDAGCDQDVCSVCLSPFAQQCATPQSAAKRNLNLDDRYFGETDVESEENLLLGHQRLRVVTKCQHAFHQSCLEQVKTRKAECPNCRAQLTPIAPSIEVAVDVRATIVSNANRVRHNMQLAAARRRAMESNPHE
jgi:hypothetical protein